MGQYSGISPEPSCVGGVDRLAIVAEAIATWSGVGQGEHLWFLGTLAIIRARGWRAALDLQRFGLDSRLCEPALDRPVSSVDAAMTSSRCEGQRRNQWAPDPLAVLAKTLAEVGIAF